MRKFLPFTLANNFTYNYVKHCTADFETSYTDDTKTDVHVWSWGLGELFSRKYKDGKSLDDFMDLLLSDRYVYDVGIHNLKFDGNFILPYLYRHGYKYVSNNTFMNCWKNGDDMSKLFTHNITAMGQWFSITIVKDNINASPSIPAFIHLWDTLKLFPQTLDEVGKQYCKDFKKIELPQEWYERIRPVGFEPEPLDREYQRNDVMTLAEALEGQFRIYGTIHRTRASKAFSFFKSNTVSQNGFSNLYQLHYEGSKEYLVPEGIEGAEEYAGVIFRYVPNDIKAIIRKAVKKLPETVRYYIPNYRTWEDIKYSYRGGISYVNPKYKELNVESTVTVIDRNSMYPAEMKDKPIPFGNLYKEYGKPDTSKYGMWIAQARVSFKLKEEYHLPCIQMKGKYGREWLAMSTDYMEDDYPNKYNDDIIWFTSVDYETFLENYDFIVWDWMTYYGFRTYGNDDGFNFISQQYNAKQQAEHKMNEIKAKYDDDSYMYDDEYIKASCERQEAKIIMNSAYGKHGTKYVLLSKSSEYIDDNTPIQFRGEQFDYNKEPDDPSHYYCPYASFVTSYARQSLVRMWNSFKGRALYCDTDSVHFLGTEIDESMDSLMDWDKTGAIGLWKVEGTFIKARYIRAKTYIEVDTNNVPHVTCAGATKDIKRIMDWDTFRVGFDAWEICSRRGLDPSKHSKLKPRHLPSGVALEAQNFQIRAK